MNVPELLATINAGESSRVSPEELKRLYQSAGKLYAERQLLEESGLDDIDRDLFKEFYQQRYQEEPESADIPRLLENLRLAKDGKITLAGALLFGRHNEVVIPDFFISVVWFWGNDFIANDVLPYRGIGSGILKSLQAYPAIDFEDNKKGEFFKATINRPEIRNPKS